MCTETLKPGPNHERGAVLLAVMIIVFLIAAMSLAMLDRQTINIASFNQQFRITQSGYGAESAIALGVAELKDDLIDNHSVGTLGNPSSDPHENHREEGAVLITSSDPGRSPFEVRSSYSGHPLYDRFDNDADGEIDERDEDGDSYMGMPYLIRIAEWSTDPDNKIGAVGMDDDGDGQVDESGEVNQISTSEKRIFTVKVSATYHNYTTERTTFVSASMQSTGGNYGLFAGQELELGEGTFIDSFDSQDGSYTSQATNFIDGKRYANARGNVGTNGELEAGENAYVMGDVNWGPGDSDAEFDEGSHVEGEKKALDEEVTLDPVDFPDEPVFSEHSDDDNRSELELEAGETRFFPTGEYHFESISTSERCSIEFGKNSTVVVGEMEFGERNSFTLNDNTLLRMGDFDSDENFEWDVNGEASLHATNDMELSENTTLDLQDGKFKLYAGEDLEIDDVGQINPDDDASKLQIYGGNEAEFEMGENVELNGFIYTPDGEVEMDENAKVKGAILAGSEVEMGESFELHYDESLNSDCDLPFINCNNVVEEVAGSWVTDTRGGKMKGY